MTKLTQIPQKLWQALPFTGDAKPFVMHVNLTGVIATDSRTGKNLNLPRLEKALDTAFEVSAAKAVVISVNSPGGSPVQSRLIHDRIRHLAAKHEKPVYTFIEDAGASGGYILAIAGDEVYADESSIVGSIGVISGGFGFPEAIEKLGVERRVHTAGRNKSQLDPFRPEDPEDIARHQKLLDKLHEIFISLVRERRNGKLRDDEEIFTGQYWAAEQAKAFGLIDEIGHLRTVIEEKFGEEVRIRKVPTEERSLLQKFLSRGPVSVPRSLVDPDELCEAAERRLHWARFGL